MTMPKTVREMLEDGTLGPLRTREEVEAEDHDAWIGSDMTDEGDK